MNLARNALPLACITLLLAASVASADGGRYGGTDRGGPGSMSMLMDFAVARPLGLATTILGAGVFVVTLPFAAIVGDIETPAERLVGDPARYTFQRPLGAME